MMNGEHGLEKEVAGHKSLRSGSQDVQRRCSDNCSKLGYGKVRCVLPLFKQVIHEKPRGQSESSPQHLRGIKALAVCHKNGSLASRAWYACVFFAKYLMSYQMRNTARRKRIAFFVPVLHQIQMDL